MRDSNVIFESKVTLENLAELVNYQQEEEREVVLSEELKLELETRLSTLLIEELISFIEDHFE